MYYIGAKKYIYTLRVIGLQVVASHSTVLYFIHNLREKKKRCAETNTYLLANEIELCVIHAAVVVLIVNQIKKKKNN